MKQAVAQPVERPETPLVQAERAPTIGFDPIESRLQVTRPLGATLSIIGIATAQLAAHLGVYDVPNLRRYELFGVVSLVWLVVFWAVPWSHSQRNLPAIMSLSCLGLVGGTVALTGAGNSLAWIYAMPLAFFNSLYFRPIIAVAILPGVMATGILPAALTQNWPALKDQVFIVAPVYVIVTIIGIALLPELRGTADARLQSLLARQRAADAERWMIRLEAVQEAAREAHQSSSIRQICEALVAQIRRAVDFDTCLVHLVVEDHLEEIVHDERGDDADVMRGTPERRLSTGEGIPGWVAREAQPLHLENVTGDSRSVRIPSEGSEPESVISIPLTGHGKVVGVITLYRLGRGQFTPDDLRSMMMLGDHAGTAICNAQILATAREEAETDGLTGLLNQSAGRLRLGTLLGERRPDQSLSVILLDLDGFKPINDALGHLAGDKFLRRVADILRSTCREGDVISRSGGDEFMVALPDAAASDAHAVGASISRLAISEGADLGIATLTPIFFTFGTATAPDDGETITQLLEVADSKLYSQKHHNRRFSADIEESSSVFIHADAATVD